MRSRWVCHGASGNGSSSSCANRSATSNPLSPSAASVPAAPPNCSASASRRNRCNRTRERCKAAAYSASFRPNGIGSACCSQVRATTGGVAMLPREDSKARNGATDIGQQRIDAFAQGQHRSGVDHVLAGGAPMHIARGLNIGHGDIGGQRLDKGDREIAGARRGLCQGGKIERPALQAARNRAAALCGITPVAASARARAASKSSMCCRHVTSSQTARMAGLDSMGASRGENEVLMMCAT